MKAICIHGPISAEPFLCIRPSIYMWPDFSIKVAGYRDHWYMECIPPIYEYIYIYIYLYLDVNKRFTCRYIYAHSHACICIQSRFIAVHIVMVCIHSQLHAKMVLEIPMMYWTKGAVNGEDLYMWHCHGTKGTAYTGHLYMQDSHSIKDATYTFSRTCWLEYEAR